MTQQRPAQRSGRAGAQSHCRVTSICHRRLRPRSLTSAPLPGLGSPARPCPLGATAWRTVAPLGAFLLGPFHLWHLRLLRRTYDHEARRLLNNAVPRLLQRSVSKMTELGWACTAPGKTR